MIKFLEHMAVKDFSRRCTVCMENSEIEEINKKLLKVLPVLKVSSSPIPFDIRRTCSFSSTNSDNDTDPQLESGGLATPPTYRHYGYDYSFHHHGSPTMPTYLPPIGVFWDIENCQVPKGRSAIAVTQVIREKFFSGYREAEFIVVCDVKKENKQIIQELNDAQVTLIHVASTCKNAADEKLKQSIRRFADIHGSSAAIILISGDINFAVDLSDLRYRKKIHVILLHKENTSEALILCANEHYDFVELMESLPFRTPVKVSETYDLLVYNLPKDRDDAAIKRRLKQLSDNCGGRVMGIQSNSATIRFTSQDFASRAQKRMDGEYVFGSKIIVKFLKDEKNSISNSRENTKTRDYTVSESESVTSTSGKMYNATIGSARSLPVTPHYHSTSPMFGTDSSWNGVHYGAINSGIIQQSPMYVGRNFSNNSEANFNRTHNDIFRTQSPLIWQMTGTQQFGHFWDEQYKIERSRILGRDIQVPQVQDNNCTITNEMNSRMSDGLGRIRGYSHQNTFKRRSPSPLYTVHGRDINQRNGQNQQNFIRTPSPYESILLPPISQQINRTSPYYQSDTENEEIENFFNPINNRNGNSTVNNVYTPVELQVTNLDQNIDPKHLKRVLSSVFMEHVMVLHVSVFLQSDGNFAASVRVPSLQDAQYAISQLHRRKIGYKRILISYAHNNGPNLQFVRSQIVMLLQEVPGHKLPLFTFREMYESRFMVSISVSELYKMKDVCVITEDPSGRMISLHPDHRNTPSPCFSNTTQGGSLELPYCIIHTQKPWSDKGWAEQEMASLPNVRISLKILFDRLNQLLTTHNGSLPLPSLPNCYEAEFKEPLNVDENGVPLEHLVSCLPSIKLKQGVCSVKYLFWIESKNYDDNCEENKCVSPPLANQLVLFSRELVDLLKTAPHCQLSFNRFIPAYHHHFGRQCRVADYGFTKLIDLLEALTHTVQVMGEGNKRVVTLSHRAQVRRFTSDLLRVLKAQASKQVALSEFPSVYARVIAKSWDVVDYGVCHIEDILNEVSENAVVVTNIDGGDKMIAIPKREQTAEEIERTKQFAIEAVELLRHASQCRMMFNKFVPSYHHHFGHQCRVSDYGFTKLIELFEAIPDVIKIEETTGGERRISLTEKMGLWVLGEQISKLVSRMKNGLRVSAVARTFLKQFGYALRPELFNCNSMLQLMEKLNNVLKIVDTADGPVLMTIDKSHLHRLALQCRRVLMDEHRLPIKQFEHLYFQYYVQSCNLEDIEKELPHIVQFTIVGDEQYIELTPLQCFACNLYRVMMSYGGTLSMSQFESAYLSVIGSACTSAQYGFPTVSALLQALPCTIVIKETRYKRKIIYLNKKLATVGISLPPTYSSTSPYRDTDSGNDSFESDTSSRMDASNESTTSEERNKWSGNVNNSPNVWKQKVIDPNIWQRKGENNWTITSTLQDQASKWSMPSDSNNENFFKNFMYSSIARTELPLPPIPDSPTEVAHNKEKQWNSSVWVSPPKYSYSQDEHSINVNVPPLTVPQWNQMSSNDSVSNLMSPAKNLLSAAANPLNPRTSPYYSSNRTPVPPHPSELPLPSLSLTPKKSTHSETTELSSKPRGDQLISNSNVESNDLPISAIDGNVESDGTDQINNTTSKRLFSGKRRLAAQFNQPIDS